MNASTSLRTTLTHVVLDPKNSPDVTIRQMAIMLNCYAAQQPCTVRGMADTLKVSKPSVTRAFQRLETLGLLKRQKDPADARSVLAMRTKKGEKMIASIDKIGAPPVPASAADAPMAAAA